MWDLESISAPAVLSARPSVSFDLFRLKLTTKAEPYRLQTGLVSRTFCRASTRESMGLRYQLYKGLESLKVDFHFFFLSIHSECSAITMDQSKTLHCISKLSGVLEVPYKKFQAPISILLSFARHATSPPLFSRCLTENLSRRSLLHHPLTCLQLPSRDLH